MKKDIYVKRMMAKGYTPYRPVTMCSYGTLDCNFPGYQQNVPMARKKGMSHRDILLVE